MLAAAASGASASTAGHGEAGGGRPEVRVVALSPPAGSRDVAPFAPIRIIYSIPPGHEVPHPRVSPLVPGHWSPCGVRALCFEHTALLPLGAAVTVSIARPPTRGSREGRHRFLASFRVAPRSVGLAQVLLARLGYLPLRLRQQAPSAPPGADRAAPAAGGDRPGRPGQDRVVPSPRSALPPVPGGDPARDLRWRYSDIPRSLRADWHPGQIGTMTRGAIVQFERVHRLGSAGWPPYRAALSSGLWTALLRATSLDEADPYPYSVATVSEASPEDLTVWTDGTDTLRTLVNTGLPGATTPEGTFFVYLRYRSQTMRGVTTTGDRYLYRDVPDVSYFSGNIAIHGFVRPGYGFPQSQGCVEVPLEAARKVYAALHYGSLVVVS